jgi:site-specific DNA-methyltransferase (adenine-specific)
MIAMKEMQDKQYDLAIVDPPYQLDGWHDKGNNRNRISAQEGSKRKLWDKKPLPDFFIELKRVSKEQIIWGGNYFNLGTCVAPIVWDKKNREVHFADGEFAWTSFSTGTLRMFRLACIEMLHLENRIHPTQKPVKLYEWLLKNYAKEGDKIIDTHGGSMSIAIACYNMGFDLDLYEIDKDYFEAGSKRLEEHKRQGRLFEPSSPR